MLHRSALARLLLAGGLTLGLACSSESPTETPSGSSTGGSAGSGSGSAGGGSGGAAGSAGTSGTAGASAGSGGAAGASGSAGSGGSAGAAATLKTGQSAGCGIQNLDEPNQYVEHAITVDVDPMYADQVNRRYFTKVPENYDPNTPLPVVFYGPGCGGDGEAGGAPPDGSIRNQVIEVFMSYVSNCFKTGGMNSPEIPYFVAVLDEVEANFCVDKSKIFVSGYSSGAWLSQLLGCAVGDRIRAIGTAAGGLSENAPECKGNVAAIMHVGTNDNENPIVNIDDVSGVDEGTGAARDRLLAANGCSMTATPWHEAFPTCELYDDCGVNPVVWCPRAVGHLDGEDVARTGFWEFWSHLPPP